MIKIFMCIVKINLSDLGSFQLYEDFIVLLCLKITTPEPPSTKQHTATKNLGCVVREWLHKDLNLVRSQHHNIILLTTNKLSY